MKTRLLGTIFAILLLPVGAYAYDFYEDGWITDGNVFDFVNIWNNAEVDMTGGVVTYRISTYNTSTLNIYGGDPAGFELHDDSVLNLSGGLLNGSWIYPDHSTVNIYGCDLTWVFDSEKRVHGYWADDTEFLITFARIENATVVFHEIPEPSTMALTMIGILGVRKFRG